MTHDDAIALYRREKAVATARHQQRPETAEYTMQMQEATRRYAHDLYNPAVERVKRNKAKKRLAEAAR